MTLHTPYDNQNIFAKILRGEVPCAKVYEDGGTLVIMDAFPQSMLGVKPKDIGRLFGTVQRVAQAVDAALQPDGIVVTQFNGAPAGQTVFHTHVHIKMRVFLTTIATSALLFGCSETPSAPKPETSSDVEVKAEKIAEAEYDITRQYGERAQDSQHPDRGQ